MVKPSTLVGEMPAHCAQSEAFSAKRCAERKMDRHDSNFKLWTCRPHIHKDKETNKLNMTDGEGEKCLLKINTVVIFKKPLRNKKSLDKKSLQYAIHNISEVFIITHVFQMNTISTIYLEQSTTKISLWDKQEEAAVFQMEVACYNIL